MGAAIAWEITGINGAGLSAPVGTGRQSWPAVRRLSVVPAASSPIEAAADISVPAPGARRDAGGRAEGVPTTPTLARRRIGPAAETASSAFRLTRWGRLLCTLALVAVLAAAAVAASARSGGASASSPQRITIAQGQTLSGLAVTYLPDLPIAQGVDAIRVAIQLQNDRIIAGDTLVIPRH